jgi:hypothetical protein
MNLTIHSDDMLGSRDIRRYPSEIDLVPSRGVAPGAAAVRKLTFSEVTANVEGTVGAHAAAAELSVATSDKPFSLWEKEDFGFGDFIDIINPLHHIPIVATLYRNLSGDHIGAGPRVIGGAVWGRVGGLVAGVLNAVVEWWSGKDIGDHIYAAMFGPANKQLSPTAVAQKKVSPTGATPSGVAVPEASVRQIDANAIATTAETPPAAAPASNVVGPAGLRSQTSPILAPTARAALSSYEKNLDRHESSEPYRVRFAA